MLKKGKNWVERKNILVSGKLECMDWAIIELRDKVGHTQHNGDCTRLEVSDPCALHSGFATFGLCGIKLAKNNSNIITENGHVTEFNKL